MGNILVITQILLKQALLQLPWVSTCILYYNTCSYFSKCRDSDFSVTPVAKDKEMMMNVLLIDEEYIIVISTL